ncbi:hypothetical protein EB077_11605, partial [bacterium]|nr:hypothetical protein [bacterium]
DPEFSILVDTTSGIARPQIQKYVIDLQANTSLTSNVTFKGDYALLDYTQTVLVEQPIANRYRNIVALGYGYRGSLEVYPKYDNYYDTTQGSVNVTIDLATPLNGLVTAVNNSVAFKNDSKTVTASVATGNWSTVSSAAGAGGTTILTQQRNVTNTTKTVTNSIVPGI